MELEFDNAQHLRNDTSFDDILHYDRSRDLFDYLLLSISGSTILLQMFITWLILCRTPENMREYQLYLCGMSVSSKKIFIKYKNNLFMKNKLHLN
jgi:hypothetical protein